MNLSLGYVMRSSPLSLRPSYWTHNRTFVPGVSLPVAWIGLSRLEIMAKFMATRVR